jgi:hypothetical protein
MASTRSTCIAPCKDHAHAARPWHAAIAALKLPAHYELASGAMARPDMARVFMSKVSVQQLCMPSPNALHVGATTCGLPAGQ